MVPGRATMDYLLSFLSIESAVQDTLYTQEYTRIYSILYSYS